MLLYGILSAEFVISTGCRWIKHTRAHIYVSLYDCDIYSVAFCEVDLDELILGKHG